MMRTTLHDTPPTPECATQWSVLMTSSYDSHTSVSSLTTTHTIINTGTPLGRMSTRQNLFSTESYSAPEDGDIIIDKSGWTEDVEKYSDNECDDNSEECTVPFTSMIEKPLDEIIWKFDMVKDVEEELINSRFREYTGPSSLKDGVSESFGNPT